MAIVTVVGEVVVDRFITDASAVDVAGGSAANVALALHGAGHEASFRARYSTDPNGEFLRVTAMNLGIDITHSVRTDDPATLVEILLDDNGVPAYQFHLAGAADWNWSHQEISPTLPHGTMALTFGSLAAVLDPGSSVLLDWAKSHKELGLTIAYDPNARPSAMAQYDASLIRERIMQWISASDVVKVSDEDIAWIEPDVPALQVAKHWSQRGPQVVVLTGGSAGAWAFRDGNLVSHIPAPVVNVVDTVGAGDTLMAWLVAGLMDLPSAQRFSDEAITQVVKSAVYAAAVTCTRQGCQPPRQDDVKNLLD